MKTIQEMTTEELQESLFQQEQLLLFLQTQQNISVLKQEINKRKKLEEPKKK